jgi:hypothetical protein
MRCHHASDPIPNKIDNKRNPDAANDGETPEKYW